MKPSKRPAPVPSKVPNETALVLTLIAGAGLLIILGLTGWHCVSPP